jgi:hypothetical protein
MRGVSGTCDRSAVRRDTHKHLDVVGTRLCFDDLYLLLFAQLSEYPSYVCLKFSVDYFSAEFRCKHDVVLASPCGVCAVIYYVFSLFITSIDFW